MIVTKKPQPITDTLTKLLRFIRLGTHFRTFGKILDPEDENLQSPEDKYDPSLYCPSSDKTFNPKEENSKIMHKFNQFSYKLKKPHENLPFCKHFNLSQFQRYILKELRLRHDLIIGNTDKNLGPFFVPRIDYMNQCLTEHLLKDKYYRQLEEYEAILLLSKQRDKLKELYGKYQDILSEMHNKWFTNNFELLNTQLKERISQFYGQYKVHKDFVSVRPIISCCGTLAQVFSKYIDWWLKRIVRTLLPSYLPNVETLISSLQEKFPSGIPTGGKLFSIDAISMYSNIDTDHGIAVVKEFFEKYKEQLPSNTPTDFLIESLTIIMKENIFQFGDTYWIQEKGCTMGTSAAVNYAYI